MKLRWESKSGKHWIEATDDANGCWSYRGVDCGGVLGIMTCDQAKAHLERFVVPYAQPDANKTPMKEVTP